jgi:hypothetical protein
MSVRMIRHWIDKNTRSMMTVPLVPCSGKKVMLLRRKRLERRIPRHMIGTQLRQDQGAILDVVLQVLHIRKLAFWRAIHVIFTLATDECMPSGECKAGADRHAHQSRLRAASRLICNGVAA